MNYEYGILVELCGGYIQRIVRETVPSATSSAINPTWNA